MCRMVGATRLASRNSVGNAARSGTLAGVTIAATRMALVSTSMWRLTPWTFVAPSNRRGRATGDALTLDESATAAAGRRLRPGGGRDFTADGGRGGGGGCV